MRRATILDFDGVIVDSKAETVGVAIDAYVGFARALSPAAVELVHRHRGLVGPVWHYLALLRAIDQTSAAPVEQRFDQQRGLLTDHERDRFEHMFFALRAHLQKNLDHWLSLNPLTDYGKTLVAAPLQDYFIVTTKPAETVRLLLEHHRIAIGTVLGYADFVARGTKGAMIDTIFAGMPDLTHADFIDDNTEHLDSIVDPRVTCWFADWGYGSNARYPLYRPTA